MNLERPGDLLQFTPKAIRIPPIDGLEVLRLWDECGEDHVGCEGDHRGEEEGARSQSRGFGVKGYSEVVCVWDGAIALVEVADVEGGVEEDGEPGYPGAEGESDGHGCVGGGRTRIGRGTANSVSGS